MEKIEVKVTKEDIEKGEPKTGRSCPIALAASRVIGTEVYVDYRDLTFTDEDGELVRYYHDGIKFIQDFDYDPLDVHEPLTVTLTEF